MEMNKDEAAKCQSLGDRYYRAQQYEKSIKYVTPPTRTASGLHSAGVRGAANAQFHVT